MKTIQKNPTKKALTRFPFYFLLMGIFVMTTASTCEWEHDDDDDHHGGGHHSSDVSPAINSATSGTWKIAYYYDSDTDRTAQFAGYQFTFNSNNALLATNGENSFTGNWSITSSSHSKHGSDDDHGSDDLDFNISFVSPDRFAELTDDWEILSYSGNRIELIDISGGNGGTDYITFEKI